MLAVDVKQSTVKDALVVYQKHLESLREQRESNLPRNGKDPATAEDISSDRAFDERFQAIACLLHSTSESLDPPTQHIRIPSIISPTPDQTVKPKIFDEFDTEPYLNPFTGQLIIPDTPFTAGSSTSHINANPSRRERHEPHSLDHLQRPQTVPLLQKSLPQNPRSKGSTSESLPEAEIERPRPPSYTSTESSRLIDTRSTVPIARSYSSQPEALPIPRSRWGTLSRLKHISSFRNRRKNNAGTLEKDDVRIVVPETHHAAGPEGSPTKIPVSTTDEVNQEKNRQNIDQHHQVESLKPVKGGQTRPLKNRNGVRSQGFLALSNQTTIDSQPPAPSLVRDEASKGTSSFPNSSELNKHQYETIMDAPTKPVHRPLAPNSDVENPSPPVQHTRATPIHLNSAASVNQEATQPIRREDASSSNLQFASDLAYSPPSFQTSLGQTAGGHTGLSDNLAELALYDESLRLAFELSGGLPQDYASLKQIQEEHEMSAQMLASQKVAKELARDLPQDYTAFTELQAHNEGTLQNVGFTDAEWQNAFEADRKMAQSLAAEDVQMEAQLAMAQRLQAEWNASEMNNIAEQQRLAKELSEREDQLDLEHQLKLQEEARLAKEIAEREDRAEMEAQLAMAWRLQAEWNASEVNNIAEQQNLARELSERENRLDLEWQNAELQRVQTEGARPEPMQTTNYSMTGDDPPAYTPQTAPSQIHQESRGWEVESSDHLQSNMLARKSEGRRNRLKLWTRQSPPQEQATTNPSSNRDTEELSRIIAERRARHDHWQADVQKANQAAKEAEENIRRRAREDEEEIRRLEEQKRRLVENARKEEEARRLEERQRKLAEEAQKQEEARRAAIEAERRSRQAECTVCGDTAEKSDMAILACKHAYHGDCIARKSQVDAHLILSADIYTQTQRRSGTPYPPRSRSNAVESEYPSIRSSNSCLANWSPRIETWFSNSPHRTPRTVPILLAQLSSLLPKLEQIRQLVLAVAPIPAQRAKPSSIPGSSVNETSTDKNCSVSPTARSGSSVHTARLSWRRRVDAYTCRVGVGRNRATTVVGCGKLARGHVHAGESGEAWSSFAFSCFCDRYAPHYFKG